MRRALLVGLFAILLGDIMLGLGLGLGPGLSLKNALLYILFVGLVFDYSLRHRDLLPEARGIHAAWIVLIAYAMFTWLAISLLGLYRGYSMLAGFISLKNTLIDLFLFFLLFLYGPRTAAQALNLTRWLVGVIVVANLVTFVDVFNIPDLGIMIDREDSRVSGPIGSVNQYASVLVFIVPITAGFAIGSFGWLRRFFLLGALIGLVLLGLTISRGAFVGLFMGVLLTMVVAREHISKAAVAKGAIAISVALLIVTIAIAVHDPSAFVERFQESASASVRDMSSGRTEIWSKALTMMSYSPITFITGYGWNAYATLFLGYSDPHNVYLQYFFNLGIVGVLLFLFIVYWIYQQSMKGMNAAGTELKPLFLGFIFGWLSLLVSVFFVGLYLPWLFIWACTGSIVRLFIESTRENSSGPVPA